MDNVQNFNDLLLSEMMVQFFICKRINEKTIMKLSSNDLSNANIRSLKLANEIILDTYNIIKKNEDIENETITIEDTIEMVQEELSRIAKQQNNLRKNKELPDDLPDEEDEEEEPTPKGELSPQEKRTMEKMNKRKQNRF